MTNMNNNNKPTAAYDDDAIRTLSPREHLRLRPGMYIGKLGDGSQPDDGIYVLIKETVDNSIDEFIMGAGNRIDITIESTSPSRTMSSRSVTTAAAFRSSRSRRR